MSDFDDWEKRNSNLNLLLGVVIIVSAFLLIFIFYVFITTSITVNEKIDFCKSKGGLVKDSGPFEDKDTNCYIKNDFTLELQEYQVVKLNGRYRLVR